MDGSEKCRCGDTVKAAEKPTMRSWGELWVLERQMRQRGRMENALASALNIIATLYYAMLNDSQQDTIAKIQNDPVIVQDIRRLEGMCL